MTAKSMVRRADIKRAISAARAGGLEVGRVELTPDGRIVIHAGGAAGVERNPWDGLLGDEAQGTT